MPFHCQRGNMGRGIDGLKTPLLAAVVPSTLHGRISCQRQNNGVPTIRKQISRIAPARGQCHPLTTLSEPGLTIVISTPTDDSDKDEPRSRLTRTAAPRATVLIGTGNLPQRSCGRDGQFIRRVPESGRRAATPIYRTTSPSTSSDATNVTSRLTWTWSELSPPLIEPVFDSLASAHIRRFALDHWTRLRGLPSRSSSTWPPNCLREQRTRQMSARLVRTGCRLVSRLPRVVTACSDRLCRFRADVTCEKDRSTSGETESFSWS